MTSPRRRKGKLGNWGRSMSAAVELTGGFRRVLCFGVAISLLTVLSVVSSAEVRRGSPIEEPSRLPYGFLKDGKLYSIVLPGGVHRDEPLVDWEYGLWRYDVHARTAKLLLPLKDYDWLYHCFVVDVLPDGRVLLHICDEDNGDYKRMYLVRSDALEVQELSLNAYDFALFGLWPTLDIYGDVVILHGAPFRFKVLTLDQLLSERDSNEVIDYPRCEDARGEGVPRAILPLTLKGKLSAFLMIENEYGFRIIDEQGTLLYQAGHTIPWELLNAYAGFAGDRDGLQNLIGSVYPFRKHYSKVIYSYARGIRYTADRLVAFYDERLHMVFICSPLADLYGFYRQPVEQFMRAGTDYIDKDVVGMGLARGDKYMLLYEDGTYFMADYHDIAEKVRSGQLDPLAGLKELLKQRGEIPGA